MSKLKFKFINNNSEEQTRAIAESFIFAVVYSNLEKELMGKERPENQVQLFNEQLKVRGLIK